MFFQPAILALLFSGLVAVVILALVAPFSLQTLRHWDLESGSERQIALERRTHLLATLARLVFGIQGLALLLTVFNADRMAVMFVGAMCAVGTLAANDFGFPMLYAQIAAFFLAAVWLAIDRIDRSVRDYPLVRVKYALLIVLLPLAVTVFALQWSYFGALRADVITSCCGSLFSGHATVSAEIAALEPRPAMVVFFGGLALATIAALVHWRWPLPFTGAMAALVGAAGFAAGIAGVVSVVSLYVYEDPLHHCPFCLLKAEYGHVGYLLYVPLFAATAAALAAGALQAFGRVASLARAVPVTSARLAGTAAAGFALTALAGAWLVLRSPLVLIP